MATEKNKATRLEFLGTQHTAVRIKLESDKYDGELLDTKVSVEAGTICWIAGSNIESFLKELDDVIQKYAI
jgi:hypothetical protein